MTHKEVVVLLDGIHKSKTYTPNEWEAEFLNDLSFYATMSNIKISEKQGKCLQKIYRKSQEDV